MRERLRSILAKIVGCAMSAEHLARVGLSDNSKFVELGIDSLDLVEFFVRIEEEFGVQIPEEAFGRLQSLEDVLSFLEESRSADVGGTNAEELTAGSDGRV